MCNKQGFVIYTYSGIAVDTGVNLEDKSITDAIVNVKSGDEILTVRYKNGMVKHFDSAKIAGVPRDLDFYDGLTEVKKDGRFQRAWGDPRFRFRKKSDWIYSGFYE